MVETLLRVRVNNLIRYAFQILLGGSEEIREVLVYGGFFILYLMHLSHMHIG